MNAIVKLLPFSVEQYLVLEQNDEIRHEYVSGQIYAMGGASDRHGLIVNALAFALTPAARQRRCQLFTSDMKVRIEQEDETFFYYPDLLLSCEATDRHTYYRQSPCLLIEVLSNSTARIDRHEKLLAYTQLASLQAYLLVAQDKRQVEVYRRVESQWLPELYTEGSFWLPCLDLKLSLSEIYEDTELL